MRASRWLLGVATASSIIAAIASGCGGSTNSNTTQDSGTADVTQQDVTQDTSPPKEAAAETGPTDAAPEACTVDADLSTLPIPDASLGDSGATTEGCVTCVEAACPTLISDCNASCACKTAFIAFESCLGGGGSLLTCGQTLAGASGLPLSDITCAVGCATPCGVTLPAGDGGKEGGGEGGGGEGGGGDSGAD